MGLLRNIRKPKPAADVPVLGLPEEDTDVADFEAGPGDFDLSAWANDDEAVRHTVSYLLSVDLSEYFDSPSSSAS
jgi:hypothetical protein